MVAAARELAVPLGVESPACSSVPAAAAGRGFCAPSEVGLGLPPGWGGDAGGLPGLRRDGYHQDCGARVLGQK